MSCTDRERELVERHERHERARCEYRVLDFPVVHVVVACLGYLFEEEPETTVNVEDAGEWTRVRDEAKDAARALFEYVEEFGPVEAEDGTVYRIGWDGGLERRGPSYPRLSRLYGTDRRLEWAN